MARALECKGLGLVISGTLFCFLPFPLSAAVLFVCLYPICWGMTIWRCYWRRVRTRKYPQSLAGDDEVE